MTPHGIRMLLTWVFLLIGSLITYLSYKAWGYPSYASLPFLFAGLAINIYSLCLDYRK